MKTIYVNREVKNHAWGGGAHFVRSLVNLANQNGFQIISKEQLRAGSRPDYIFIAGLDEEDGHPSAEKIVNHFHGSSTKIIYRINDCDARKGTTGVDERIKRISEKSDGIIHVSDWMKEYHEVVPVRTCVIRNGVDTTIFKPNKKFDNGKINIVTFHWSDNKNKGYDLHQELDNFVGENSQFSYTYIGRHQNKFKNTIEIKPLYGVALGAELGKYDISITGTIADPGPNTCLESIACGLPTYASILSGGAAEFVDQNHVFDSWDGIKSILLSKRYLPNTFFPSSWEECMKECFDFIGST